MALINSCCVVVYIDEYVHIFIFIWILCIYIGIMQQNYNKQHVETISSRCSYKTSIYLFKVNNTDIRTKSTTSLWCIYS